MDGTTEMYRLIDLIARSMAYPTYGFLYSSHGSLGPTGVCSRRKEMCRNIKVLYNFDPPANQQEIEAAALQFVRKISGFNKPSKINQGCFDQAITDISRIAENLLESLQTSAGSRNREDEIQKARARFNRRFAASI